MSIEHQAAAIGRRGRPSAAGVATGRANGAATRHRAAEDVERGHSSCSRAEPKIGLPGVSRAGRAKTRASRAGRAKPKIGLPGVSRADRAKPRSALANERQRQ